MELVVSRPEHRPALEAFLGHWNSLWVARGDALVSALDHPAALAWTDGELRGVAGIPRSGAHGIPLRDELELEKTLPHPAPRSHV